jgi:hypothetical protein
MFKNILKLAILGGLGWYFYTSGIFYNLTHEMQPELGRRCEVVGPIGEGVDAAGAKESLKYVIDAKIGTASDKAAGRLTVAALKRKGELATLADHTPVKIMESSKLPVLGYPYTLTRVEIIDGEYKGSAAWVQREDVIDSPIYQLHQSMRATKVSNPGGRS